ncbi:MAG: hypothetical protein AAF653_11570, partial [Chloroflexota bacterium]
RFVGRAFGTATFWLALLIALRVDGLWTVLRNADRQFIGPRRRWNDVATHALLVASLVAGYAVTIHNWRDWTGLVNADEPSGLCLAYLYALDNPTQPVTVRQLNYSNLHIFLDVGVRHYPLGAAYRPLSLPPTYYNGDLRQFYEPPYAMPTHPGDVEGTAFLGYEAVTQSPIYEYNFDDLEEPWRCLWRQDNTLPYAFAVRVDDAERAGNSGQPLPIERLAPLTIVERSSDHLLLAAPGTGGARSLAVVQEIAYPGWRAYINSERVPAESVGGYLGALLPFTTDPVTVMFVYRPLLVYIGAAITLTTIAFCVLYLLRADRLLTRRRPVTPPPDG